MTGEEEPTKQDILKALRKHRRQLTAVINSLGQLDEIDNRGLNRVLTNQVIFGLFTFIDGFTDTEIDIHNFMYRRG